MPFVRRQFVLLEQRGSDERFENKETAEVNADEKGIMAISS
jgi:hypothetical protein